MFESAIAQATPLGGDRARARIAPRAARPVYVIGGSLGSRKTTTLLRLLAHVRGTEARFADRRIAT